MTEQRAPGVGDRIKVKFEAEGVVVNVGWVGLVRYEDELGVQRHLPMEGLGAEGWTYEIVEPVFEWKVGDIVSAGIGRTDGMEAKWLRVLQVDGKWHRLTDNLAMGCRGDEADSGYVLVMRDGVLSARDGL
jgi:hypothetical protein